MDPNKKIIDFVFKNKCLYDYRDKHYRDFTYKTRVWEKLARELKMTSAGVKTRWKMLRDGYMKYKKSVEDTTGSEQKHIFYTWADELTFLDNTRRPRTSALNISATNEQPESSFASTQLEELEMKADALEFEVSMDSYHSSNDPWAAGHTLSPTDQTFTPLSNNETPAITTQNPKQNESDIEKVLNYLKKKEAYDGTDHLFLSYASTFKKLSIPKQAEIKVKLAQLFAEAEVSEFSNQRTSVTKVEKSYSVIPQNTNRDYATGGNGENSGLHCDSQTFVKIEIETEDYNT